MTYFGTSAAFVSACIKAGIQPNQQYDLSAIRGVGSTGSPLTTDGFHWIYDNVNRELALESLSGGTDLCTAFVGGARIRPIYAGEIQGASLGAKVQAFDDSGEPVMDEVGELVITEPMPSMPLYFWNDPDMARYTASYFEMFPGVWRHGDWITINERGGCVIYGRSDSTINRQGIRMGTSEIYRVVEGVRRSDRQPDHRPRIPRARIVSAAVCRPARRLATGRRFARPHSQAVARRCVAAPCTRRHLSSGADSVHAQRQKDRSADPQNPARHGCAKAANPGAMRNPVALDYFVAFAKTLQAE